MLADVGECLALGPGDSEWLHSRQVSLSAALFTLVDASKTVRIPRGYNDPSTVPCLPLRHTPSWRYRLIAAPASKWPPHGCKGIATFNDPDKVDRDISLRIDPEPWQWGYTVQCVHAAYVHSRFSTTEPLSFTVPNGVLRPCVMEQRRVGGNLRKCYAVLA